MTDNEVIMALECCTKHAHICHNECPLFGERRVHCDMYLMKEALALINRQKSEIKKLKSVIKAMAEDDIHD